jgi:uncharacterized protein
VTGPVLPTLPASTAAATAPASTAMTDADPGAALYGRGLSFPPRLGPDGGLVWSTGEVNVRECLCTILRTAPGERAGRPQFGCGLDRMLFEPNSVATLRLIQDAVTQAIADWEPRVRLGGVQAVVNDADPRDVDLTITYTLVATGAAERLAMTISPAS